MSSTSSDSEMGFGSEGSEIYYIAEVGAEDEHRKFNSYDDDQADLYADDPQANEEWTAKYHEIDAEKELERTPKASFKGNDM